MLNLNMSSSSASSEHEYDLLSFSFAKKRDIYIGIFITFILGILFTYSGIRDVMDTCGVKDTISNPGIWLCVHGIFMFVFTIVLIHRKLKSPMNLNDIFVTKFVVVLVLYGNMIFIYLILTLIDIENLFTSLVSCSDDILFIFASGISLLILALLCSGSLIILIYQFFIKLS